MDTTAFQVAKGIGDNLSRGYQKYEDQQNEKRDLSSIDSILSEAMQSQDPNANDIAMNKILSQVSPARQKMAAEVLQKRIDGLRPKAPIGGLSGSPVPQEVTQAISKIVQENPNATSDELALKLDEAGVPRGHSNSYIENRRKKEDRESTINQKKFESERSYQSQRAIPYVKKLDEQRESLQEKDQALSLMKNSLEEGNLEFFSRDNFANFLGQYGEGLRTAKGAQLITAQKEFLLGNIARAGARPNMYIEKQISNMLPKIGRSDEANFGVVEAFQAQQDLQKKKMEISDELIDKFEKDLGYIPGNISSQVDKMIKPYADQIQKKLAYNLRNIQENEMGEKELKSRINKNVSKGTPLTLQAARLLMEKEGSKDAAFKKAKSLGYTIPSIEEYKGYSE